MRLNKIFLILSAMIMIIVACKKADKLPVYENGTPSTLSASVTTVVPRLADSNRNVIDFTWSNPNYKTDPSNYKFVLQIDTANRNFTRPFTRTFNGPIYTSSLRGRELNNILLNFGFAVGDTQTIDVRVVSSYANNNELYQSNVVRVRVRPFNDSATLTSQNSSVSLSLANANQPSNMFTWTRAFTGYTGNVTYSIQYDSAGKNFSNPSREILVGTSILTRTLTQAEMNTTALNSGVTAGNTGRIQYRIKAVAAQGGISLSNVVFVNVQSYQPIIRLYLPGSYQSATGNGSNWTPANAPELIRDIRSDALNKLYYTYIYLPANSEFKVTQGRSWDVNFGGTGGNLSQNGANFSVTNAGVYRISIDLANNKYDIREGRMGFVGGSTGAGWEPKDVFPNYAMGYVSTNLFLGVTNFTLGDWKMIDFNNWNSGAITADNARSYGSNGTSGSTMDVNAGNFPSFSTAGRYRVIWDGRDVNNIKYTTSPATEMRLVGDGIQGVNAWDPPSSPQMTYNGNGVWQITVTLIANRKIKFLAGNAWGAFDYEDASGESNATGTPRKIQWDGGPDFKTPTTTGTYTITLDEKNQTVTIN